MDRTQHGATPTSDLRATEEKKGGMETASIPRRTVEEKKGGMETASNPGRTEEEKKHGKVGEEFHLEHIIKGDGKRETEGGETVTINDVANEEEVEDEEEPFDDTEEEACVRRNVKYMLRKGDTTAYRQEVAVFLYRGMTEMKVIKEQLDGMKRNMDKRWKELDEREKKKSREESIWRDSIERKLNQVKEVKEIEDKKGRRKFLILPEGQKSPKVAVGLREEEADRLSERQKSRSRSPMNTPTGPTLRGRKRQPFLEGLPPKEQRSHGEEREDRRSPSQQPRHREVHGESDDRRRKTSPGTQRRREEDKEDSRRGKESPPPKEETRAPERLLKGPITFHRDSQGGVRWSDGTRGRGYIRRRGGDRGGFFRGFPRGQRGRQDRRQYSDYSNYDNDYWYNEEGDDRRNRR